MKNTVAIFPASNSAKNGSVNGNKFTASDAKKIKGARKYFPARDIEKAQKDTSAVIDRYPHELVFNSDTSKIHPKFNGAYSLQPKDGQFTIKKGDNKYRLSVNTTVNATGTFNASYFCVKSYSRDLVALRELKEERVKWGIQGGFERRTYVCEDGSRLLIYRNKKG